MGKIKDSLFLKRIYFLVSHLIFVTALVGIFFPIAKWYYHLKPLVGTDFFLTKAYVSYLADHFSLRPFGWKYIWSGGYPLARDYPTLHFYLILPLTNFFSQIESIQIYMLFSTFLFGLFAYFLFYEICKSRWFSFALSAGCLYSAGYYGSLIWGGGLPYYATQPFLPLVLWLIIRHFQNQKEESRNRKSLVLAGFLAGVSFLAHPQAPVVSIMPMSVLFIVFWKDKLTPFFSKVKIIDLFLFLVVSILTGYAFIKPFFLPLFNLVFTVVKTGERMISPTADTMYSLEWELNQLWRIYNDSSLIIWPALLAAFVFFLMGSFLGRKMSLKIWLLLPFILALSFSVFNLVTWAYRLNPFQGGWYRAFWGFPLLFGGLAACFWGAGRDSLGTGKLKHVISLIFGLFVAVGLLVYLFSNTHSFFLLLGLRSNFSSAFPRNIDLAQTKQDEQKLKQELVPDWFEADDKNHRLFSIDAAHNLGWSSFFTMPLVQGYIDPPIPFVGRGYLYLTDITLAKDELVKRFDYSTEDAKKVAQFVIDWSAIRYFEGGYTPGRNIVTPMSSYVTDLVIQDEGMNFPNVLVYDENYMPSTFINIMGTHFYEFKPEVVSPILGSSSAPTIAIVGKFGAIDFLTRTLAVYNFNSRFVVPVIGPEKIDDWNMSDYKKFDAIFLYGYDYSNHSKSWSMLDQYVKQGGKLLIDTGGDTKETASKKLPDRFPKELPDLFPVRKTDKEYVKEQWDFAPGDSNFTKGIDFTDFGPAKLDGEDWGVSFAEKGDVDRDAKIILYDHGKVVMAEKTYGKGKVIWSGLNLPYHVEYYKKPSEREFLIKLLGGIVPLEEKIIPQSKVEWISPEKRKVVVGPGTKGILFKEYYFDGWKARLSSNKGSQDAKVYTAGPAYPGYMYVPVPLGWQDSQITAVFSFRGRISDWLLELVPILSGLVILDYVFFRKKLLFVHLKGIFNKFFSKTSTWWEKEEEE